MENKAKILKKEKIVNAVRKLYSAKHAKDVEKTLGATEWELTVKDYLKAKANIDVATTNINAKSQLSRCVAFIKDNPNNRVIKFFIANQRYKPAGLTTTVQLAYLCDNDWKDNADEVLHILEVAKTTKVKDRKLILNHAGYKDGTVTFIEYLLQTELSLSLFETKSKYYKGSHLKNRKIYDAEAEAE